MRRDKRSVQDILTDAITLDELKTKEYANNRAIVGELMLLLFPGGVTLDTPERFARFNTLVHIINKISRYCGNFDNGGHFDSAVDLVNYAALLVKRTE